MELGPLAGFNIRLGDRCIRRRLYWRESGPAGRAMRLALTMLRVVAIGLVLFMIAEWLLTLERTGLPYVVVLVDDSGSMAIADRYDEEKVRTLIQSRLKTVGLAEMSRINLAKTLLLENDARLLKQLNEDYKLKVYFISDSARASKFARSVDR